MRYLIILFACIHFNITAQSWCPPGATWTHQTVSWGSGGYITRTYTGDTLIAGFNAQRIHHTGQVIGYFPGPPDTTEVDLLTYTALSGELLLSLAIGPDGVAWDTLHRFDAVPGDRWFPPFADDFCANGLEGMLSVTDTGYVEIDGMHLRTWDLIYLNADGEEAYGAGRFTERMGYATHWDILPSVCIIVEYGEMLTCYSDDELTFISSNAMGFCHIPTSIKNDMILGRSNIHPNPGTDHFTLQLPPGLHELILFDAQGRMVLRQQLLEERTVISTASLPSGIYHIHITDGHGRISGQRWIKY